MATTTLVAATIAGFTLRGDWVAPALWLAALGLLIVHPTIRVLRHRVGLRHPLGIARTIAGTHGPLGRADADLRHEVLGATELLLEVGRDRDGLAPRDTSHLGSPSLALRYVDAVGSRLEGVDPIHATHKPNWSRRLIWAAGLIATTLVVNTWPGLQLGLGLIASVRDGRPAEPPRPVWTSLLLELEYPEHTGREQRAIPNPSGALRVPAGTTVHVTMTARSPASLVRIVVGYDPTELASAPPAELVPLAQSDEADPLGYQGSFVVRGAGAWTIVLLDEADDDPEDASERSAALPLELEPDRPPDVELLPLGREQREPSEHDTVDIRFHARDDFGLAKAELVYQLPDGTSSRLDAGSAVESARSWRKRYTWDLSQIPIEDRTEVLYWVEVRDNDPGLGLIELPDPPGKVTRSATMRLFVRDEEAEHAANIAELREIRDRAIDLLGVRMVTDAYDTESDPSDPLPHIGARVAKAREITGEGQRLLAMISTAADALSMDALAHERDVATLTNIHKRLIELHREELEIHEDIPPGAQFADPDAVPATLVRLRRLNGRWIRRLEDEIIRLDDLVDSSLIERLEALLARLTTAQQKLVDLLEQLKAGDESVRPQIEQLQARIKEILRRIAEVRAQLRKELGSEFMNVDAFKILEQLKRQEQLQEMLQRNDVDGALEQARGELESLRGLHGFLQQQLQSGQAGGPPMSEEDRKRMKLLRELSRLKDEEQAVQSLTKRLHDRWREAVGDQAGDTKTLEQVARKAERLRKRLEGVNDARLGRDGRRGLEDSKEALQRLEAIGRRDDATALEAAETAEVAGEGIQRAVKGSKPDESEGRAVRRVRDGIDQLRRQLRGHLPGPGDTLKSEDVAQFSELTQRQHSLQKRRDELMRADYADGLPEEGRGGMRQARRGMGKSSGSLGGQQTYDALEGQRQAVGGIQRAIDSLRRSPPPPPAGSSAEASTEADRDVSLREALMEAMREGAPSGFDDAVKRYYEELLR